LLFFHCCGHFHLTFKVNFSLLIPFLPVFDLLVSPVNKMVAGRYVVMTVVFDAFLGVFAIKCEFLDDFVEKLIIYGHLFLAWENAQFTVTVFDL